MSKCNLKDVGQQGRVKECFRKCKPLVAVMGATCRLAGELANYKYWRNYEAWPTSCQDAAPHGRFGSKRASIQEDSRRFFLCEQPKGRWLFVEQPLPLVKSRGATAQVTMGQCTMGLKTKEGLPAKIPTVLVSNSIGFLDPCHDLGCKG